MKIFEAEGLYYDNWRRPNKEELEIEWKIKEKKESYRRSFKPQGTDIFDSKENFFNAVQNARVIRSPLEHDQKIARRSFTRSIEELDDLVMGYAGAKYRKGMPQRILNGFKNGDAIPMPLILRIDGNDTVIAGNTRLDVARIVNIRPDPKVLLINGDRDGN